MHVRVVELMVAGVRRPREECLADPGTIGTLSIGESLSLVRFCFLFYKKQLQMAFL